MWGEGLVTITHTCVTTNTIRQTCSQETEQVFLLAPAVIMSPAYPKYYQAGLDCRWRVVVPPHQTLVTRVLDLQLGDSAQCQDRLQIDQTLLPCGEVRSLSRLLTSGSSSLIQFKTGLLTLEEIFK